MRIYVAGPYTKGDVVLNCRDAVCAAEDLISNGHIPYVPHLNHMWHMISPHPYGFWLGYDIEWLKQCEALLRLPGESAGADKEVVVAKTMGIPVYFSLEEVPIETYGGCS